MYSLTSGGFGTKWHFPAHVVRMPGKIVGQTVGTWSSAKKRFERFVCHRQTQFRKLVIGQNHKAI